MEIFIAEGSQQVSFYMNLMLSLRS